MPHKHLLFRSEAREKVLRGATAITDAVRVTLGPKSRCVPLEKKWGKPVDGRWTPATRARKGDARRRARLFRACIASVFLLICQFGDTLFA
jgi:hypothetical protein